MATYKIHIDGQVEGVGFRPHAYQLASAMGIKGTVTNGSDGVTIIINGSKEECHHYYHSLISSPPPNSRITHHSVSVIEEQSFLDFTISASTQQEKSSSLITPDIGLCEQCRKEIHDPTNRRYHYPFATCLQCGPRYSIMTELPYDRENTTMDCFTMCDTCKAEYSNPHNRRHYSQTNSCSDCAITLSMLNINQEVLSHDVEFIMTRTLEAIADGGIVAVKGIGGFLLLADATNEKAIVKLRQQKHRTNKPFALLYPSISKLKEDAVINDEEEKYLDSKESPIVILALKEKITSGLAIKAIAPNLSKIGVMLPYTPLLEILAATWNKPLIATSGNVSNSTIIYTNDEAATTLLGIADILIINNRDIVIPQDDSVLQIAPKSKQPIFLRRSRGYAPTFLSHSFHTDKPVLAMGGDLKSAFALLDSQNLFVSQYIGNLETLETHDSFKHTLNNLLRIYNVIPERILIDQHPEYFSSSMGRSLSHDYGAQLSTVQHHLAHFSAVLGEHNLMNCNEPVLGVVWDGTGWGEDNAIWGGEFFSYQNYEFKRVEHLDYFDHLLGDKISREPRLSALSLCKNIPLAHSILQPKFSKIEWDLYNRLLANTKLLKTSSIGRLFDGVASMLGLCNVSTYEGEAAMYLEALANKFNKEVTPWTQPDLFSQQWLIKKIIDEMINGTSHEEIAWQFHVTLVNWVAQVAMKFDIKKIAFSGGVFQNALLVDLLIENLEEKFDLFFHQQLSPNDECIGFGQIVFDQIKQFRQKQKQQSLELSIV